MRIALSMLLAFALAACASNSGPSAASSVYAATNAYAGAQTIAIQYVSLPRCGAPMSPPICSQQSVVNSIRVANNDASIALAAAQKTVLDPNASSSVTSAAVIAATNAVQALQQITNKVQPVVAAKGS